MTADTPTPAADEGLRMDAYYYEFDRTGSVLIDRILSAVACAGKAYHHTEYWTEATRPYEEVFRGAAPVDWIQNAANDAAQALTPPVAAPAGGDNDRFWLVLREPGATPERKGPWPNSECRAVLREFMAARPTAYIDVVTLWPDGPEISSGPEWLQVLDGRSMSVGRRHNKQTREAHAAHHAALAAPAGGVVEASGRGIREVLGLPPIDPDIQDRFGPPTYTEDQVREYAALATPAPMTALEGQLVGVLRLVEPFLAGLDTLRHVNEAFPALDAVRAALAAADARAGGGATSDGSGA